MAAAGRGTQPRRFDGGVLSPMTPEAASSFPVRSINSGVHTPTAAQTPPLQHPSAFARGPSATPPPRRHSAMGRGGPPQRGSHPLRTNGNGYQPQQQQQQQQHLQQQQQQQQRYQQQQQQQQQQHPHNLSFSATSPHGSPPLAAAGQLDLYAPKPPPPISGMRHTLSTLPPPLAPPLPEYSDPTQLPSTPPPPSFLLSTSFHPADHDIAERVAILNRVGKMLRRRVGHEREDKVRGLFFVFFFVFVPHSLLVPQAYDSLMRTKTVHIICFSMAGLISMIVGGSVTWYGCSPMPFSPPTRQHNQRNTTQPRRYTGDFRQDTTWSTADPTIKTVMLCLQIVTSLTTLVTVCLIVQYYRLLLLNKRKEWAEEDPYAANDDTLAFDPRSVASGYSFWSSSWLRFSFTLETMAHLVHPVFLMQDGWYTLFTLCQIFMFVRLYLFVRAMHTFSRAYKMRIEIINSNRDFQTMNLRIKMRLTLKMLFYSKTFLVLSISFLTVIAVFSFMIFLVERDEQRDAFGRLENVLWFSFITFTTIGFGDFVPQTVPGRVITVILGIAGVIITTMFSGVLTNKLAPTKIQRYVVEYLAVRDTLDVYRKAAARLIWSSWTIYRQRKLPHLARKPPRFGHKSNKLYGAVKAFRRARFGVKGAVLPSIDPVLEEKMVSLKQYLKQLDAKLVAQREAMLSLQSKIEDDLAAILRALA